MYYYCDQCGVVDEDDVEQKLIYEAIYYPNDDARPAEYDDLTCKGCGSYVMDYRCHDCMVKGDKDDEKLLVDEKHNMLCNKCFIKKENEMIKFEEHDNQLFRMLDKPVPLAPDAEMPCLVRLIQDDSPMGKLNKDLHAFDPKGLMPKICTEVIDVNDLSDHNRGSVRYDGFISYQYYHYELIGTPVADGSKEWALHQLMQGIVVRHINGKPIYLDGDYMRCGNIAVSHINGFLSKAEPNGWQIYKEPKIEPAKEQFEVGDWLEFIDAGGRKSQGKYLSNIYHNEILVLDITCNLRVVVPTTKIIRKLSPSEVIVHIGCLSGTVAELILGYDWAFKLIHGNGKESYINPHALDTRTRELVESLLKAMEEK